ncbi:MAG: hypothetical protein NTW10_05450 [Bacteroidetes bacterium]|nr:hypothetical protein [Bacteroidota bacterium]
MKISNSFKNKLIKDSATLQRKVNQYVAIKESNGDDILFRKNFISLYVLRFINQDHYFDVLKNYCSNKNHLELKSVIEALDKERVNFSFATKLMHTVDNDLPIYDSLISRALCLPKRDYNIDKKVRMENCATIYSNLKSINELIFRHDMLNESLDLFKKNISSSNKLSKAKRVDFIIWFSERKSLK